MSRFYIQDFALINALGHDKASVLSNWSQGISPGMQQTDAYFSDHTSTLGMLYSDLPPLPEHLNTFDCRNNRLLKQTADQFNDSYNSVLEKYGQHRIAIVLGTSTSGIANTEDALTTFIESNECPDNYNYQTQQSMGSGAEFLRRYLQLTGPVITVSTACSSSGNAFASARRLINAGFCDAAIVGGADTLCQMTVQGFSSLNSVSKERCQPFSTNRNGINIGEGAALFLISQDSAALELYGVGCSSDAHHISAPEPSGQGAIAAIQQALQQARLEPKDIDYINLHGTATKLNDAMESTAISYLFGDQTLCSSTKSLTGHTLGAAAATELALCALLLIKSEEEGKVAVPAQVWDGHYDDKLANIKITDVTFSPREIRYCLSNSFAFGGNNTSLLIGRSYETQ